jgi:hypothetical protein
MIMIIVVFLIIIFIIIVFILLNSGNSTNNENTNQGCLNPISTLKEEISYIEDYELTWDFKYGFTVVGTYYRSQKHVISGNERVFIVNDYNNPVNKKALGVFNHLGELIGYIANEDIHRVNLNIKYFVHYKGGMTWIKNDGTIGRLYICGTRIYGEKEKLEDELKDQEERKQRKEEVLKRFDVIKSILSKKIDSERISYQDHKTSEYITINIDKKIKICRLYFSQATNNHIGFLDENNKYIKYEVKKIDDIIKFSKQLFKNIIE